MNWRNGEMFKAIGTPGLFTDTRAQSMPMGKTRVIKVVEDKLDEIVRLLATAQQHRSKVY